ENSVVQVSEEEFPVASPLVWVDCGYDVAVGWIYEDGVFSPQTAPAPVKTQVTSLEFLDLFTESEQLAVATAATQSAQVKLWYDRTLAASFITLADPRTEAGLAALVGARLLTQERKDEI